MLAISPLDYTLLSFIPSTPCLTFISLFRLSFPSTYPLSLTFLLIPVFPHRSSTPPSLFSLPPFFAFLTSPLLHFPHPTPSFSSPPPSFTFLTSTPPSLSSPHSSFFFPLLNSLAIYPPSLPFSSTLLPFSSTLIP